jgi:endo-1,4-beta-D-glucanase Y
LQILNTQYFDNVFKAKVAMRESPMKSKISNTICKLIGAIMISSLSACAVNSNPSLTEPMPPSQGAFSTGVYRNLFQEWNSELSQTQIQNRLNDTWNQFFESADDNKRLYYPAGSNANGELAYILDIADNDVRTEGMSYGMMIAVQMDKRSHFNAIWNWAKTNMQYATGASKDYFSWHCRPDGSKLDSNSAPDGEEYFAAALFFAAGRWGNGAGIYNYQAQANTILNVMLHKEDQNGGIVGGISNMFGVANQVVFVPSTNANLNGFTDPSYHVAAFYDLFSQWASGYKDKQADRARWTTIANTSRNQLFKASTHPITGLNPNYSNFDGTPKQLNPNDGNDKYAYDAWRVAMNWGVDYAWFAKQDLEKAWADRLQAFMDSEGVNSFHNVYTLAGVAQDNYHDSGHVAMLATAGLAATHARAYKFTQALWEVQIPTGKYRYYSGLLYFFGLLNNAGQYKIYKPNGI